MKPKSPSADPRNPYKSIKSIDVKSVEFPLRELFDDFDTARRKYLNSPPKKKLNPLAVRFHLGYDTEFIPWLKGINLVFAFDGRQSIPFDILALSYNSDLSKAGEKVDCIKFCRGLRESGGLFLIREEETNSPLTKIWNGSYSSIFDPVDVRSYVPYCLVRH
jgi:hypothetical protein